MSLELGIVFGVASLVFITHTAAFKLDEVHEAFSLFSFLMGVMFTFVLAHTLRTLATSLPTAISDELSGAFDAMFYGVVIYGVVCLVYFILRVMVAPMLAANNKRRFKLR